MSNEIYIYGITETEDDAPMTKAELIEARARFAAENDPANHAGLMAALFGEPETDETKAEQTRQYNETLARYDRWIAEAKEA